MGQDPRDLMTDDQINKVLGATFKKFDKDGSGQLEYPEFVSAYADLGLNGTERELKEAFAKVDADSSGYVDMQEFMSAIKDSRSTELSMSVIIGKMDGQLEGMEDVFGDYKRKLQAAQKASSEDMKMSEEKFKAFQQAARRRRILKRKNKEDVQELVRKLIKDLASMTSTSVIKNHDEFTMCNKILFFFILICFVLIFRQKNYSLAKHFVLKNIK